MSAYTPAIPADELDKALAAWGDPPREVLSDLMRLVAAELRAAQAEVVRLRAGLEAGRQVGHSNYVDPDDPALDGIGMCPKLYTAANWAENVPDRPYVCQCGTDDHNAWIDALLKGGAA